MKVAKLSLVLFAVIILVLSAVLTPLKVNANDEESKIRYVIFTENGILEGTDIIPSEKAGAVIRAIEKINGDFRLLKASSTPEDVERAKAMILSDIASLSWLKIFAYILDRIEDIIDAYLTPWTKVSVFPHIFIYGHGRVCIPLERSLPLGITRQTFIGLLLRPIWWDYNCLSFTVVRKGHLVPPRIDFWDMWGNQRGFMIGFLGIHISIIRPLIPDTHVFIGRTLMLVNKDLLF
ncbi:MAG: hypothetical protein U9O96_03075 [Candidatus Thermoplasmatota archaeon]|nr:hypothetical protein [Candidatus Thermoplasmatota archaeon]